MRIGFYGAAGTVTGSKFLIESGGTRVLVDCGLYQGVKQLRERNWARTPWDPAELDAVVLTHAHIDHSGYLPALVRDGFEGTVHATPPTQALCELLLPDSGRLQEEDAEYANRKRFSKHDPALPLYTEEDALRALERFSPLAFDNELAIGELRIRFSPAGHILGAASLAVRSPQGSVVFSGDLGRSDDLLMRPPAPPPEADWIVVESTYGDRLHPETDPVQEIAGILRRTLQRGGTLLMPSFAVGRAQTLLYCLHEIFRKQPGLQVPVYVNSPMATSATALYQRFVDYHRLSREQCAAVCDVAEFVRSVDESRELNARKGPMVIISASGMATGGRVLHHLRTLAPDERNTILLPGFQAPGTRGADLAAGVDSVKIHGRYVPVRAEVVQLGLLSAHADRQDLLDWLRAAPKPPREVFVVHGEPAAADALRRRVKDELGCPVRVSGYREIATL
jgi:metallo-beta-lactamase family protein